MVKSRRHISPCSKEVDFSFHGGCREMSRPTCSCQHVDKVSSVRSTARRDRCVMHIILLNSAARCLQTSVTQPLEMETVIFATLFAYAFVYVFTFSFISIAVILLCH